MTQPMDMRCEITPQGQIDAASGEFWVTNPFDMLSGMHNFSAYESNKFLLNRPDGSFIDLSFESRTDLDSDSRSAIAADFDRDGDLDLLIGNVGGGPLRLFQNRIPKNHHRVRLELRLAGSGRPAIGAHVVAELGDQQLTRDFFPVNGFMGQSPAELILGVGDATRIQRLTVRWPDGSVSEFADLPVDAGITIVQGDDSPIVRKSGWRPSLPLTATE